MNKTYTEDLFTISIADVQHLALEHIGRELTDDELHRVRDGLQFGLECWENVALTAIQEVIEESHDS